MRSTGNPESRSRGRPGAKRAFAMLDLMISVLILGLLLVPLALSRNNVIVSAGHTVMLRKARVLAAAKIGELELAKPEDLAGGAGDFGPDYPGFTWEAAVETLPLWDVVGQAKTEDAEGVAGVVPAPAPASGGTAAAETPPEVVRLTLHVKFDAGEEEEPKAGESGEESKLRPVNTIEIVRYYRKEPVEAKK